MATNKKDRMLRPFKISPARAARPARKESASMQRSAVEQVLVIPDHWAGDYMARQSIGDGLKGAGHVRCLTEGALKLIIPLVRQL